MMRVIGAVLTFAGLAYYGWHLLTGAAPIHPLQVLIGAALCVTGLFLALTPKRSA